MLFSEPKIPQSTTTTITAAASVAFQCSSASRKFLNEHHRTVHISNRIRFSALQRAENSSIETVNVVASRLYAFQCSSASRKFLNQTGFFGLVLRLTIVSVLFSEPKIPQFRFDRTRNKRSLKFQCSSASRKFLNNYHICRHARATERFSALQRAENSSILSLPFRLTVCLRFSALQRAENSSISRRKSKKINQKEVSVLFSEPKIPQSNIEVKKMTMMRSFSALQRAENSSMSQVWVRQNFCKLVSVLFSEPKIPQSV